MASSEWRIKFSPNEFGAYQIPSSTTGLSQWHEMHRLTTQNMKFHATGFQPVVDDGETKRRPQLAKILNDKGGVRACP